jgi:hypothetical protein
MSHNIEDDSLAVSEVYHRVRNMVQAEVMGLENLDVSEGAFREARDILSGIYDSLHKTHMAMLEKAAKA